ncbi:MAG: TspO/MBR family protein [Bacteroidota bacterium]
MQSLGLKITICIIICLTLGFLSGISTAEAIRGWYATIQKPAWNPPNGIFGPVWSLLYCLMGISLALVWHQKMTDKSMAYIFFAAQLALNLLWSFIFFKWQSPGIALIEIMVMWCMILLTILQFYNINKTSAYLLLPYLLWVSFATVLNATIVYLN